MTTPHRITAQWPGATVAVLATGPSLTPELVARLRRQCDHVIAVNDAHRLAPWADMLVALDGEWPADYRAFAGLRITGVSDPDLDALYIGPQWTTVRMAPGHQLEIINSGLTAVRIAADMGATTIHLAGYDHPAALGHFGDQVRYAYTGLAEGMAALLANLAERGIRVVQHGLADYGPAMAPVAALADEAEEADE